MKWQSVYDDPRSIGEWLEKQDVPFLMQQLDEILADRSLDKWEERRLARYLADVLVDLDYGKCSDLMKRYV